MLQQDLLDTLFLNRKALANAGSPDTHPGANGNSPSSNNFAMKDVSGTGEAGADVCPVDHKSREAWLKHAQAVAPQEAQQPSQPQPPSSTADACPVDHKSREAWLKQAQNAAAQGVQSSQPQSRPTTSEQQHQLQQQQEQQPKAPSSSGWGWRIPFFNSASNNPSPLTSTPLSSKPTTTSALGQDREVSTIPRSTSSGALFDTARPSNHETETGADARTGNWVYPSEKMFFDAMKRKGHDTRAADMKTVVPIHNAVNERAWVEIKEWERPYQGNA